MSAELLTVGHGTASADELAALLVTASVELVVDVRRFPGSRNHPHVARTELATWLPERGADYRWDERLGGRRRLPKHEASHDPWWTVEQFRAYAAHTRTAEFQRALEELMTDAAERRTAVMCSESVWWRCHRRLIADVVVLTRDAPVRHLMHDGRLTAHVPAAGARVAPEGLVVWDVTVA